jgi:outer membrane protein assembly factor BamB
MRHALMLAALSATPALAENWPGWRGPTNDGVSTERNLPARWSATENVLWRAPLLGTGVSTPVVWGDRIFVTCSDGRSNDRLHLLCLNRDDGKERWHARFFGTALSDGQFAPGGMAVPTPATDGQRVYALFGTGDLVCVDFDGKPLWVRSLAQEYGGFRNRWGMAASPILVGDLLVVQVDHWGQSYLLGVDAVTGANRWKTNRDASVNWASPLAVKVDGKTQIVASGTYAVKGYSAQTGEELWTVQGMQMQCIPSPVASGDRLFAVSGRDHFTLAIRLDGARGDLTKTHIAWKAKSGAAYVPSPVVHDGLYYFVEDTGWGSCLRADSGAKVWRERLGGNKYSASPLVADGKVYFASEDGTVTVIRAGAKFAVLARNDLGEPIVASPAVSGGRLFVRGDKHLYCIGEK